MFRSVLALVLFFLTKLALSLPTNEENRVVNGTSAKEGEFPFMASLRSSSGSHFCGCSILNKEWVLTAAHCVEYESAKSISIQYGVNRISPNGPNIVKVKQIIFHEGYDPFNTYIHDIALLQMDLQHPLEFNDMVHPVTLPQQSYETPGGSNATLVGWGLEKSGGSIQEHLQKVDLITFSDEDCSKRHNGITHKSNLCAGVPEGGKGQCSGDSGGPLIVNKTQLGIVSWSIKPCTVPPYPGVFTKVSHYVNWITQQMSNRQSNLGQ